MFVCYLTWKFPHAFKWSKTWIPVILDEWIINACLTPRAGFKNRLKQLETKMIIFQSINSMENCNIRSIKRASLLFIQLLHDHNQWLKLEFYVKFVLCLKQGWGEYQICEYEYKYEYLEYVWVRVRVWVLDYCMSTSPSPSTGWWVRVWVRVPAYDLHSI